MKSEFKKFKTMNKESGITLITLIVMIIIIMILASVTIGGDFNEEGVISKAQSLNFKARMADLREKAETHMGDGYNFNEAKRALNVGPTLYALVQGNESLFDIEANDVERDISKLEKILGPLDEQEKQYLVIYHGELYYVSMDNIQNNEQQTEWCREIGIKIINVTS